MTKLTAVLLGAASILAVACGSSKMTAPTSQPIIQSLAISASMASLIAPGQTAQASVVATMSSGASQDVTTTCVKWQTTDATVLTVNNSGLVTAHENGSAAITTTCQGVAARALLKVAFLRGRPSVPVVFSLSGAVTDGVSGGIVPNVLVQILEGSYAGDAARTDAAGSYLIGGLTPGTFTVAASADGYQTALKTLAVTVMADTHLDLVLTRIASY